jgi:hypothetical protein
VRSRRSNEVDELNVVLSASPIQLGWAPHRAAHSQLSGSGGGQLVCVCGHLHAVGSTVRADGDGTRFGMIELDDVAEQGMCGVGDEDRIRDDQ